MKVYDGKTRREVGDKTYWDHTGFILFENDKGHLSLRDARTGQSISFFERKPKEQAVRPDNDFDDVEF